MATWTFLTNHGHVLIYIGGHPDSTGLEIAQAVGITERAVRKIVAELQAEGYSEPEKVGRRNRYRINTALPLRLRGERAVTVGELLELLWRDRDQAAETGAAGVSVGPSLRNLGEAASAAQEYRPRGVR